MDEMACRGHKHCDIDGQSDIASLISPPLCLTHTFLYVPLTSISHFIFCVFSVLLWLISALCHLSFLPVYLSLIHLSSRHVLMGSCAVLCLDRTTLTLPLPSALRLLSLSLFAHTNTLTNTQIPIIISQDQTTTTLCEGHRGKKLASKLYCIK